MKNFSTSLACGLASVGIVALISGCCSVPAPKVSYCECGPNCTCSPCLCGTDAYGRWALKLPYDDMNTGWLKLDRAGKHEMLLRWASPFAVAANDVKVEGSQVTIKRHVGGKAGEPADKQIYDVFTGTAKGLEMDLAFTTVNGEGKLVKDQGVIHAFRIPAVGPAPDLAKAVYAQPINLLEQGRDGWVAMNPNAKNFWSVKDGVLSNRVKRDPKDGHVLESGTNIKSVRADFMDFNLKTKVRLPKDSNSGIYLRGIYEIQMCETYGKPVDCHNMGALYGRVTPSVAAEKPAGEWQDVDITLYKRHVTVVLNGTKIIDNAPVMGITGGAMQPCEFTPGPIYLQGDHSDVDYKDMVLTPIVK